VPDPSRRRTEQAPTVVRLLEAAAGPAALSAGRALVGAVMLVRPSLLTSALAAHPVVPAHRAAAAARTTWVVQMLGAREVGLGLGALRALRAEGDRPGDRPGGRRAAAGWLAAGLLADAVDAVALAAAIGRGHVRPVAGAAVVAVAASAVAVQAGALGRR